LPVLFPLALGAAARGIADAVAAGAGVAKGAHGYLTVFLAGGMGFGRWVSSTIFTGSAGPGGFGMSASFRGFGFSFGVDAVERSPHPVLRGVGKENAGAAWTQLVDCFEDDLAASEAERIACEGRGGRG
jgi:hypothetical protein